LAPLRRGNGIVRVTLDDRRVHRYFDDHAKGEATGRTSGTDIPKGHPGEDIHSSAASDMF
jgi:hypothetical protein